MSLYDYKVSKEISANDYPFGALIMAAFRKADSYNLASLQSAFPVIWSEFDRRYHAPAGCLTKEEFESETPKS